jgi:hypothetical protein
MRDARRATSTNAPRRRDGAKADAKKKKKKKKKKSNSAFSSRASSRHRAFAARFYSGAQRALRGKKDDVK